MISYPTSPVDKLELSFLLKTHDIQNQPQRSTAAQRFWPLKSESEGHLGDRVIDTNSKGMSLLWKTAIICASSELMVKGLPDVGRSG